MKDLQSLTDAEKRELIEHLSAQVSGSDGKKRRRPKKASSISYLVEDEITAFFRAIDAEGKKAGTRADAVRDRALFEVALGRGLRASEVGLLELKHLRMKDNRLYVTRLKGGRTGEYLITERETKALKSFAKDRGWLPGPLFCSRNKRAISRRRLDELHKMYGKRAGLAKEKMHFHCWRHTCATRLLSMGVGIEQVQDILGHEDIRNTMIYAKIINSRRLEIGEKVRNNW